MSFLDLTGVKEQKFEALQPGVYTLQVDKAETKNTKAGDGQYIELGLKVAEGEFQGRMLRHRFNIKNKSEVAQDIGLSQLKTFLICAGHSGGIVETVSDLVGLKAKAMVHLKNDMNGVPRPEVKYFQTPTAETEASAPAGF